MPPEGQQPARSKEFCETILHDIEYTLRKWNALPQARGLQSGEAHGCSSRIRLGRFRSMGKTDAFGGSERNRFIQTPVKDAAPSKVPRWPRPVRRQNWSFAQGRRPCPESWARNISLKSFLGRLRRNLGDRWRRGQRERPSRFGGA